MEYVYNWKVINLDNDKYSKELFISALNCAFAGIRTPDLSNEYYANFVNRNISLSDFVKYPLFSFKYIIILFSKLFGLSISRLLYTLFYNKYYR